MSTQKRFTHNLAVSGVSVSFIASAFAWVALRPEARPFVPASEMPSVTKATTAPQTNFTGGNMPRVYSRVAKAPWVSSVPNGVEIELYGIGEKVGETKKWWTPDAKPIKLSKRPYPAPPPPEPIQGLRIDSKVKTREVALRLKVPEGKTCKVRVETGMGYAVTLFGKQAETPPLQSGWLPIMVRHLPVSQRLNLRIGICTDGTNYEWLMFDNFSAPPLTPAELAELADKQTQTPPPRIAPGLQTTTEGVMAIPRREGDSPQPSHNSPNPESRPNSLR